MPNIASLVLKDQASTPADTTFAPRGKTQNDIYTLAAATGQPLGDPTIKLAQNRTSGGRVKPRVNVAVPVVGTDPSGKSLVVRTNFANIEFNFDGMSTLQERKDVIAFARNALAVDQTMMQSFIRDLEDLW